MTEGRIVSAQQDEQDNLNGRVERFKQHGHHVDAEVQAYRNWRAARAAGKKNAAVTLRGRKNKIVTASKSRPLVAGNSAAYEAVNRMRIPVPLHQQLGDKPWTSQTTN
jgi:hypothetical protein